MFRDPSRDDARRCGAVARTWKSLIIALLATFPAIWPGSSARAHALDVNTARVTLRDDHIEVWLEIDLLTLVSAVNPRYPDATALAVADEAGFEQAVKRTRDLLQSGSRLTVDAAAVQLLVTGFPPTGQVRFMAAAASANPQDHGLVPVRLETLKPVTGAKTLSLSLPREAGSVLYTFIQPSSRLATAGERVGFSVLVPQANAGARTP